MKLSVCMIVKNEETVLERCLVSVKSFADELIIVDTGSDDGTKEIARRYTEKVFDFKWINDFSAARNFAFSNAVGDYLMWLDADDVVLAEDSEKINLLKTRESHADTYMFKYYVGVDKNGKPALEYYRERVLKNCPAAKFRGYVHECVAPFGKIEYCDIKIVHKKEGNDTPERNLDIFKYHLSRGEIMNARERYYYAKEFYYLGKYDKCADELEKYFLMENKYLPDEWDSLLTCFCCYEKLGRSGGEKFLFNALEKFGVDSKTLCFLGDYYKKRLKLDEAENYYKMSLICDIKRRGYFQERKYEFLEPCLRLVALNFERGDYKSAKKFHYLCLKRYPDDPSVIFNDKFFK